MSASDESIISESSSALRERERRRIGLSLSEVSQKRLEGFGGRFDCCCKPCKRLHGKVQSEESNADEDGHDHSPLLILFADKEHPA
eukprot:7390977-Prymnesium_polylepis.2